MWASALNAGQCAGRVLAPRAAARRLRCIRVAAETTTSVRDKTSAIKADYGCPYEYGHASAQGIRDYMEDEVHAFWDDKHGHIYACCYDGHGGDAAALWLKDHLHDHVNRCLEEYLAHNHPHQDHNPQHYKELTDILVRAFEEADKLVLQHLETMGNGATEAGSTASVAVVRPERVVVGNVGDSQVFMWRGNTAFPLITPHRVHGKGPEVKAETERVAATGGWVEDGRVCSILAVARAFGDADFKGKGLERLLARGIEDGFWDEAFAKKQKFLSDPIIVTPDATDTDITKDDLFMVMATDGLWDYVNPGEAMKWARNEFLKGSRPTQVAEALVQLALKKRTTDNVSAVVVDLKGADFWRARAAEMEKNKNPFRSFLSFLSLFLSFFSRPSGTGSMSK